MTPTDTSRLVLAVAALVAVASLPTAGIAAVAEAGGDEWADDCYVQGERTDARTVGPGTYNGTVGTTDVDAFFVAPGDDGTVRLTVTYRGDADSRLYVRTYNTNDTLSPNATATDRANVTYADDGEFLLRPGTTTVVARTDAEFCTFLRTGNLSGKWTVEVNESAAPPKN